MPQVHEKPAQPKHYSTDVRPQNAPMETRRVNASPANSEQNAAPQNHNSDTSDRHKKVVEDVEATMARIDRDIAAMGALAVYGAA